MQRHFQRLLGYALRIAVAAACCAGIWSSLSLARADHLFKEDTEQSVRSAIRVVPDGWEYYMRLAQFDKAHAQVLLSKSLQLNRYNAQADIELGLQFESDGDFVRAEKQLLQAYDVDHTYLPRWSLANYYFRRDNMPAFWTWARSAASMPAEEVGPLFQVCWRAAPDPDKISQAILNEKPELIRQYIKFLFGKDRPDAVAGIAPLLIRTGDSHSDRPMLFAAVNLLVAANENAAATDLWQLLIQKQWVVADASVPNNANFQREPLPVSFDWTLPEYRGLHSWPGESGLESEFTGSEPEDCTIAEQAVALAPGHYTITYTYHTKDIRPNTGVRWQIMDAKSNSILAESSDLSSDEVQSVHFNFSVQPDNSLVQLRLNYRRTIGTPRISGLLNIQSIQIQPQPES